MRRQLAIALVALSGACGAADSSPFVEDDAAAGGKEDSARSDKRRPELGGKPKIVLTSNVSMSDGLAIAEEGYGATIEAKFELGDDGKLSLSIYPVGDGVATDAERNTFNELAGDPTVAPFKGDLSVFHDQEHLTRSSRDLTLVQLSRISLRDAVAWAEDYGTVYWTVPTLRYGRAGYGIYVLRNGHSLYGFLDGGGSSESYVEEVGSGPGAGATDKRAPELGDDVTVVRTSQISMVDALKMSEKKYGKTIEAKFELGDDGKLSLSIYPVGKGITTDAERNTFSEVAGDPTARTFAPTQSEFTVPDEEHLTRSARDLTLVQSAGLGLLDAVRIAQAQVDGGIVYWAIPTIRDTRAGYGVYVLGADDQVHYFFVC